jgi:hypothetical protein
VTKVSEGGADVVDGLLPIELGLRFVIVVVLDSARSSVVA